MLTGLEVATLRVVVTKLISELSTDQLNKKSDEILFDQKLADLMGVLFELNAKQALKNNERWEKACTIRASIIAVKGSRFTLFRYMSSRTVYSLAKSYQKQVEQDTATAKMKAYMEKQKVCVYALVVHEVLCIMEPFYISQNKEYGEYSHQRSRNKGGILVK
ncbi:hypothetical protein DFJ43DRAFT_669661 [Lentinula guzmanii]|uniref:Uncharacterized protein n=1 Tax=Lentinula guzmanii TaxID=2804957 RepID=A0AA38JH05_9AGAR|nr:hypothetical protein DFJ43DRAFT_669661 [Lentinula guzmanii]